MDEIEKLKELVESQGREIAAMKGWQKTKNRTVLVAVMIGVPLAIYSATITKPFTFTPGTPALAEEVNENFDTLYTKVNELDGKLAAMEGKTWQLIYEKDVAAANTSISVPNLDGNADHQYKILARIKNDSGASSSLFVRPNNDSVSTNYGHENIRAVTNVSVSPGNATSDLGLVLTAGAAATVSFASAVLYAKDGLARFLYSAYHEGTSGTSIGAMNINHSVWSNTSSNITSLVFFANQTNGIGAGSHIEIWARR